MATICINFNGPINHPATTKLRNALCSGANELESDGNRKYDKLYLYFNSAGGSLDDGISLFGLIRSLPIEVTTINVGMVASIAIAPFLGGKVRIALPHALFHFHDYEWNYASAHNLTRLEYVDHTKSLDAARDVTFKLLKENTFLTDDSFQKLQLLSVPTIKDAAFAKEKGIVQEIKYYPVPKNTAIYNVDY